MLGVRGGVSLVVVVFWGGGIVVEGKWRGVLEKAVEWQK